MLIIIIPIIKVFVKSGNYYKLYIYSNFINNMPDYVTHTFVIPKSNKIL